jgi:hypothetical protein
MNHGFEKDCTCIEFILSVRIASIVVDQGRDLLAFSFWLMLVLLNLFLNF